MLANDGMWVSFSIEIGPDGAVYILDWHDPDICRMSTMQKDTGRIFRVAAEGARVTGFDLAKLSDTELVEMQAHRNDWYVRRARVLLHQRAVEGSLSKKNVHALLWDQFESGPDTGRKLRSLWALHVTEGISQKRLTQLLDDKDAHIRSWAIQLLCEDFKPGNAALKKFANMAASDSSPVVRLYLAAALQRIPESSAWKVAQGLLSHEGDADDHNLPKMIWFGIEGNVESSTKVALDQALLSEIPMVSYFIACRAVAADEVAAVVAAIGRAQNSGQRIPLLEGLRDGLAGQRYLEAPKGWAAVESELIAPKIMTNAVWPFGLGSYSEAPKPARHDWPN